MRKRSYSSMWLGFGLVAGAGTGYFLEPRAILFFAVFGVIVSVLVASSLKR